MRINKTVLEIIRQSELDVRGAFERVREIEETNQWRVIDALQAEGLAARHFAPSTGYGYDDIGRDTLDRVCARIWNTEDALVRPQIASGTHALAIALNALLRPGQTLLSISGKLYDTLDDIIGISQQPGSLRENGVSYRQLELLPDGGFDLAQLRAALTDDVGCVMIQRSRGYAWRASLSVAAIDEAVKAVKAVRDVPVLLDNCYGEFTDISEPKCDLLVGSLIKNPGGGLAPTGGILAGRADLVERCAARLIAPGIGREVGSYAAGYQLFFQGLFMAPHTVAQSVMGCILAARCCEQLGLETLPASDAPRSDIIQSIRLNSPEALIAFCQGVQKASPVDGHVVPEPWDMPGYADQVIMAAGTFVQGASLELSADGPLRPPYTVYWQGGLTYAHAKLGLMSALTELYERNILKEK